MSETRGVQALPAGLADRTRGCMLGLAVGDALGTTLEFSRRDALPRQTEMTGGGPFRLRPGEGPTTRPWRWPWARAWRLVGASTHET